MKTSIPNTSTHPHLKSRMVERSPVYYGWIVLVAGTIGIMMTTPGQTTGVSIFLDYIIDDLALPRALVSLMYTFGTMTGAFILPFVGRFIDQRGPRISVIVIATLFALACVWMGFVTSLVTLFLGFVAIRSLGQGSLSLVSLHVVNIWFVKRRGLAVGLAGLGMALATAFFPLLIETLVEALGWRWAYMALGGLVALVMIPIGALFFRAQPEQYGLQPDSSRPTPKTTEDTAQEATYSGSQARRTLTFWLFSSGDFMISAFGTGLVFHHFSIMETGGLERAVAALVFVPSGMLSAVTNLSTGFLLDRLAPRKLLSVMLFGHVICLAIATLITSTPLILVYGALLGLVQGMKGAIQASVYAYYFGRAHIGAIRGFASTVSVAGAAVGPFIFALGFDLFGSYTEILLLCAIPPLIIALTAPFIQPFRKPGVVR